MSVPPLTKVAVIAARSTTTADGIRDYTNRLVEQLDARGGLRAELFQRERGAFTTELKPTKAASFSTCASADAVIVQYNPFWHGHRGFAPGLAWSLLRLRRRAPRTTIALMVHETYIWPKNWKWALMSVWQRTQLRALQRLVDVQLCSIEVWTEKLRRRAPRVPARHLPVPSNLPDRRAMRAQARARLGVSDDTVVLVTFGLNHPGRLHERMLAAAREVRAGGQQVVLLNLGTGEQARRRLEGDLTLVAPGFLEETCAAEALSAGDIFLAAFADGVSTRRTTLMAALQHEVAVVGTNGHLTDGVLRSASDAVWLTPVDRPDHFVDAVAELARDAHRRSELARAGRRLYEQRFDWPIVIESLLETLKMERR